MRLLLVNQFFWPDCAPTSQLLTDVANGAVAAGHEVTVLCGPAGYAVMEVGDPPPFRILRTPGMPFRRDALGRMLSYGSFFCSVIWRALRMEKPDAALLLTTPPMLGCVGVLLKRIRGCPYYIWEMDIYPDIAVDLGVLKPQSFVTKCVDRIAMRIWGDSEGIIALGSCMQNRLLAKGILAEKIHVNDNWANGESIRPLSFPDDGKLTVLYSGNFGLAHDVATIMQVIQHLRQDHRFQFVFAGGGARQSTLRQLCGDGDFPNVTFRPYCKSEHLSANLGGSDLGLVTQLPQTIGSIVPSKIYGIMAAGRPILYVGPKDATPSRVIERFGCGWQIDPGNVAGLLALLRRLVNERQEIVDAGLRARKAFEQNYDRHLRVQYILDLINKTAPDKQGILSPASLQEKPVDGSPIGEDFA